MSVTLLPSSQVAVSDVVGSDWRHTGRVEEHGDSWWEWWGHRDGDEVGWGTVWDEMG